MFYYLLIIRLINLMTPILLIGGILLILWLILLAGKQFIREAAIEGVEIYSRINTVRQDKRERDAAIEAKIITFKTKFEMDRQEARLRLMDSRKALKSGASLTINKRFASGEFDIEVE